MNIIINPESFILNIKNNCNRFIANTVINKKVTSKIAVEALLKELFTICDYYIKIENIERTSNQILKEAVENVENLILENDELKVNENILRTLENFKKELPK